MTANPAVAVGSTVRRNLLLAQVYQRLNEPPERIVHHAGRFLRIIE